MRADVSAMTGSGFGVAALAAAVVLGGCSGSDVALESRPTDAGSARDLAELVADTADCRGFEDYSAGNDHWDFTCQTSDAEELSYQIRTVSSEDARTAALTEFGQRGSPVKVGRYFLVLVGETPGRTSGPEDLDAFPGTVEDPSAG
jgi:hypothetical protein